MGLLDGGPSSERLITFRFCSREEGQIYRLASKLKEDGYEVLVLYSYTASKWICEASQIIWPEGNALAWLCFDMLDLAERNLVVLESWQTGPPPPDVG